MSASASLQFTSGGLEEAKVSKVEEQIWSKMYPKWDEYQWRPSPLLCKCFDTLDAYMGKPPPLPRARSCMDSLVFTSDFVKATKSEDTVPTSGNFMFVSQPETQVTTDEVLNNETEIEINSINVQEHWLRRTRSF